MMTTEPATHVTTTDHISPEQAVAWVRWSCAACCVHQSTATTPASPWKQTRGRFILASRLATSRRIRAANAQNIESAHQLYKQRCKVAWHMHTIPFPPLRAVASYGVIASALNFGSRTGAIRAVRNWRVILKHMRDTAMGED